LDGVKIATPTHPDLDYVYETSMGVPTLGEHRIDVIAFDSSHNQAQESYKIDYVMINYPGGYTPNALDSATVSQTPEPSVDEELSLVAQEAEATQTPVAGEDIVDVLPKTGRISLWQIIIEIFSFKWIR
jgi:hypothetical protein